MTHRLIYVLIVIFAISACTDMHLRRQRTDRYSIVKDAVGTRWIDVTHGACTVRVLSFNPGHLRLAAESQPDPNNPCEPGVPPLIEAAAPAAKTLLHSYGAAKTDKIEIDIAFASQPTLIKKWAAYLKQSPPWKNRPKQTNPWDNSEYPLIKILLVEGKIFESYSPVFKQFPAYGRQTVHIEKVAYQTVAELPYYEAELRPLGYAPQERLPVPMSVGLTLEK